MTKKYYLKKITEYGLNRTGPVFGRGSTQIKKTRQLCMLLGRVLSRPTIGRRAAFGPVLGAPVHHHGMQLAWCLHARTVPQVHTEHRRARAVHEHDDDPDQALELPRRVLLCVHMRFFFLKLCAYAFLLRCACLAGSAPDLPQHAVAVILEGMTEAGMH